MLADYESLDDWLAARCGRPLPMPPGYTPFGGPNDPSEMLVTSQPSEAVQLGGMRVAIEYEAANGDASARVVRLRRAWTENGSGRFVAFCELRAAPRVFLFERVQQLIDLETGEIHLDVEAFFAELGVAEPDVNRRRALDSIRQGMQVLMALAVVDDVLLSDEIEVVLLYAHRRAEQLNVVLTAEDDATIAKVARRMRPDLDTARSAIDSLRRDRDHLILVHRFLRRVAHADDRFALEEEEFMKAVGAS